MLPYRQVALFLFATSIKIYFKDVLNQYWLQCFTKNVSQR